MKEFVPAAESDELAYLELSKQDADLLIHIKTRMAIGVTAEAVGSWARWRFADDNTVRLATDAAHYIERCQAEEDTASDDVPTSRRNCEWCGGRVEIGADYKRCLNCGRHQ